MPAAVGDRVLSEWCHLLVVASHGTPLPYLAYLRRERIPYLLAGTLHVDLASALAKFQLQLGAQCVVSTAGGGLNGALLRAGLVDELHIITVPALTGGLGTPSIIDGPPLEPGSLPVQLRAVDVQIGTHGSIWAHYEVLAGRPAVPLCPRRLTHHAPPGEARRLAGYDRIAATIPSAHGPA